jgi:hypothetical protein
MEEIIYQIDNISIDNTEYISLFNLFESARLEFQNYNLHKKLYQKVCYYNNKLLLDECDYEDIVDDHFKCNLTIIDYYLTISKNNYENGNFNIATKYFIKLSQLIFNYINILKIKLPFFPYYVHFDHLKY